MAIRVAPRAGAWIETQTVSLVTVTVTKSRPARARGLKQRGDDIRYLYLKSRPARARGLKLPMPKLPRTRAGMSRPARARGLKLGNA